MPRANRYIVPGAIYHVTHRCHDRKYLLRFAQDRNAYRAFLREQLENHPVSALGYCLTSNHTHLLLQVLEGGVETLARFMKELEGEFAQSFNRRKERSGAFWSDRYHVVMIDSGEYLWRCLRYIDMNMVRAGVVRDPAEWNWCGYAELIGRRQRNRVVDRPAFLEALAPGGASEKVVRQYCQTVEDAITRSPLAREPHWTESLAVGSREFIRAMAWKVRNRRRIITEETPDGLWRIREPEIPYG